MLCSLFRSPRHVNRAKGEAEGIHTFQNLCADSRVSSDNSFRRYLFKFTLFSVVFQLATKNLNIGKKEFVLSTQTVCKFV